MVEDTWTTRTLPVLRYIAEHEGDEFVYDHEVAEAVGLTARQAENEMRRLVHGEFVGADLFQPGPTAFFLLPHLLERGEQELGRWPSVDPYQRLLAVLDRELEDADNDEKRSRLTRFRSAITGAGEDIVAKVIAELVKGPLGLP